MRRLLPLPRLALLVPLALAAGGPACSQTPVVVPVRSMERPKDVDFICLHATNPAATTWEGVPLEACVLDEATGLINPTRGEYRLHAVVTQLARGELAVVDLGHGPRDAPASGSSIVKTDPRVPGYSFLPVGAVPADVAADPGGKAVYVSTPRSEFGGATLVGRVDIIPSEILRGAVDSDLGSKGVPWSHLDFSVADGPPTWLAAVRDPPPGKNGRLYVVLSDAQGGPRLAVFDIGTKALQPTRLPDIPLSLATATPLTASGPPSCGPARSADPWWKQLDEKCEPTRTRPTCNDKDAPCRLSYTCDATGRCIPPTTAQSYHLAGIAVAGGRLYAADDAAPFVHVFDISDGKGVEVHRFAVGSPTSRVAVSEPLPDEATLDNATALDICDANGWTGDGVVHTTPAEVFNKLGGRRDTPTCRAHRYVYAIDLVNAIDGNGTIAIADVPVVARRSADGKTIQTDPDGALFVGPITRSPDNTYQQSHAVDVPDFAAATLVTPMACDSPAFPSSRLPVGSVGLGAAMGVPARAVTFVRFDPPASNGQSRLRCRILSAAAEKNLKDLLGPINLERVAAEKLWTVIPSNLPNVTRAVDPLRLRGTFALAALENGAVVVIDVDDLDGLCRGPINTPTLLLGGTSTPPIGPQATDEYLVDVTRRHHPRSKRFFNADNPFLASGIVLNTGTTTTSPDPNNKQSPRFARLGSDPITGVPVSVLPAADNPYAISSETWTVTYEGIPPGFSGTAGSFNDDKGVWSLVDPGGAFCTRGVESDGDVATHDIAQIVDDVTPCRPGVPECVSDPKCLKIFGDAANPTSARDLVIDQAFQGSLKLQSGPDFRTIKDCFPGVTRYVVRARAQWVVVGSNMGYLHRRRIGAAGKCVFDAGKPFIQTGRVRELGVADDPGDQCKRFTNPSITFQLLGGVDAAGRTTSVRDMKFVFSTRFNFTTLAIATVSDPTTVRALASYRGGVDQLNWKMAAVVDATDRGLQVFSIDDVLNSRVIN